MADVLIPFAGRDTKFEPRIITPPDPAPPPEPPGPEPLPPPGIITPDVLTANERRIWDLMTTHPEQKRVDIELHETLLIVARKRAKYVAETDHVSHTDLIGRGPDLWLTIENPPYPLPYWIRERLDSKPHNNSGESLGYGHTGGDEVWRMWLDTSPGHKAHLLAHVLGDPDTIHPVHYWQRYVGVGCWPLVSRGGIASIVLTYHPPGEYQWWRPGEEP